MVGHVLSDLQLRQITHRGGQQGGKARHWNTGLQCQNRELLSDHNTQGEVTLVLLLLISSNSKSKCCYNWEATVE